MSREQLQSLAQSGQFESAARLAEAMGLSGEAARHWERACDFEPAARAYLAAGEPDKALLLAARIENSALIDAALQAVAESSSISRAALTRLEAARHLEVAARLALAMGDAARAGELYERATLALPAARAYLLAQLPKSAARVLERSADRDANPEASEMLARLYRRAGEPEAAVRSLQRSLLESPRAAPARRMLADLFGELGLPFAAKQTLENLPPSESLPEDLWGLNDSPLPRETLLFGRYLALERVAISATAKVYRALDRASRETVAVKLFSPTLVSGAGRDAFFRFEREVRALRELAHPSIVPFRAYHPEGPAVVLAWMSGGSLAERLERRSESPSSVVGALTRVLEALSEAHRRGILHRDIKPDNILFDDAGAAYLGDFGTAHIADHAQTVTSGIMGTLAYMAPAQRRGHKANIASDLYSVGAVLWHALSGAPPSYARALGHPDLTPSHAHVLQALLADPALESADRARQLLQSVDWPVTLPTLDPPAPAPPTQDAASLRLRPGPGGSYIDDVLKRVVDVAPYHSDIVARARAFVRADHPNLARVYRFDPRRQEIWFERPARLERPLDPSARTKLGEALRALHDHGGWHGAVDADHVGWRDAEPVLCFPRVDRTKTLREDLRGLDEL